MNRSLIVFGTRPEFIKLLPVIQEIKKQKLEDQYIYLFTGQHLHLTQELFDLFEFEPEFIISPKGNQTSLGSSFSFILQGLQEILDELQVNKPITRIIGLGDTTSSATAAMCAFFNKIPFVHIEAGLRTYDINHPFPEEYFRRIITLVTAIHFAPTQNAAKNLVNEGISREKILVVGNTIVDTIALLKEGVTKTRNGRVDPAFLKSTNNVLITCHRRENQNDNFNVLVETIKELALENPQLNFIWVSHKTPFIHNRLTDANFCNCQNISVLPPITLPEMYELYNYTKIIITDSGGIQEEAPSFSLPVIVIRSKTERAESVELGYSKLTSDFRNDLKEEFHRLLTTPHIRMANPYGDGKAAERIVAFLMKLEHAS